jgi:hypothetical protein
MCESVTVKLILQYKYVFKAHFGGTNPSKSEVAWGRYSPGEGSRTSSSLYRVKGGGPTSFSGPPAGGNASRQWQARCKWRR